MSFDGFISYSHAADGRLAPAVQRGLHRLAKPWHRRRALWIFRDQTGLSVTPGLWSSIQKALDGSEWFVLLASPEAARSPWVNREIEYWIATKPADRILPVVTDGEWRWDAERGDLSADSTAAPDALRGVFSEEPLFLDLRWARDGRQLNLRDTRFRDAIAELAAPMHGVSKDELESEDLRQHRRARRLRRVSMAALALLTVVASGTGVLAGHNADRATAAAVEAQRQQDVASEQRDNAERYADEARRQERNARTQEQNALTQEARAQAATTETKRQEKRAREQQDAAERAAADAKRQESNARRQQKLAGEAKTLAERQKALAEQQEAVAREQSSLAREQSELARESAAESARQRIIAERQQRLAEEAAAEAERQKHIARQQQRMAEEASAEARRQEFIARENERKAEDAAAEARRQEENAAEQQKITIGRRLFNQAKVTISNDPWTALKLGIAAERIQPGTESRTELSGLVTSTRRLGTIDEVLYVAYGPGDLLAVVNSDFTAALWSVADRAHPVRLAPLDGFTFVGQPVFSPDGRTLAMVGGWDFEPVLFDVSDPAAPVKTHTLPLPYAGWLSYSPDGQTLSVSSPDGFWSLWDMADRTRPSLLFTRTMEVNGPVAFSPDSRTAVTAGEPGTIWDITDRTLPVEVGTLPGEWWRVSYSPTRPLLTTNDQDGNLSVWHITDRTKPRKFTTVTSRAGSGDFSPDGLLLVTGDKEGTARLWDMAANAPVHMADLNDHSGDAISTAFSPDGRTLATTGFNGTLSLWAVAAHGEPAVLGRADGNHWQGFASALTSDGARLTTAYSDGTAAVWDMSKPAGPVELGSMRIHSTYVDAVAVSPGGDTVAALGWRSDGSVTLTDLSDPRAPVPLGKLPGGPFRGTLAMSPDGNMLAVGNGEYHVTMWDISDPRHPVQHADLPIYDVATAMAFSPDGRTLAVASALYRTVQLWSLADAVLVETLKGHSDFVTALAYSPDGRTLATGSKDRTAVLWNVAGKARRQAILTGNGAPVWSVAFAPDGRTLATGTEDDAAALWDIAELTGPVRVATLRRADLKSKSLHFHPDGRTLITSGTNFGFTKAVAWDYSALNALRADPAATACAVAGGGFTAEEWAAYIPEVPYRPTC
ncbi:TIR domain-containing protein [Actinoplanes sp. NPDC051861]|uniref:TIR domain-containing protein n=1 Tax=Actinoplanes sp. NPDC051861 TaxID=3155170 RepID=UPI003428DC8B